MTSNSPSIRLAGVGIDVNDRQLTGGPGAPTVSLATAGGCGSGDALKLLSQGAPHIRLAAADKDDRQKAILTEKPDVRLATDLTNAAQDSTMTKKPDLRMALQPGDIRSSDAIEGKTAAGASYDLPKESWPSILVSFVYLKPFLEKQAQYRYREWVLDSGAFSAHMGGKPIDHLEFLETCDMLLERDPTLKEIFALDVIGDEKASLKNCEQAWERGIPAIPCYHFGEPWEYLEHIAKNYPKIALGGVALAKTGKKKAWALECFRRVWPKKIHGFAFCGETQLLSIPFHSVDASSWAVGALKFGTWRSLGKLSIRGSKQNLRAEIEHYLKLERRARSRWAKEMKMLEELEPTVPIFRGAQK